MVTVRLLGHDYTFKAVWPMLLDAQMPSWTVVLPVAMKKGMLHEDAAQGVCRTRVTCTWAVYIAVSYCMAVLQSLIVDFPAKCKKDNQL